MYSAIVSPHFCLTCAKLTIPALAASEVVLDVKLLL
jgi:hypothetical protein